MRRFIGAVLALLALLGAVAVSGWHGADPDHHDAPVTSWSPASPEQPRSPDIDLHSAAHAVTGMWPGGVADAFGSPAISERQPAWLVRADSFARAGILEALLRPPKA